MKMLKGICLCVCSVAVGIVGGVAYVQKEAKKEIRNEKLLSEKHLVLFQMMNQWIKNKQYDKSISQYLRNQGIATVAIYGMSYVGETLFEELNGSEIKVAYAIDNNQTLNTLDIPLVTVADKLESVDAVIVTAITYFDSIKEQLSNKIDSRIISLEEIVYNL